ncbi:MAG: NTP transferase domain-containing protein [Chthonomonas sp.]|nr:NTP transferase domain-containing protein [Chthonomonas sp.]
MGVDKSSLLVQGEPLALRLARQLRTAGWEPTILGKTPQQGYAFLPDEQPNTGPLAAIRGYRPSTELVFIVSCDIPLFDARVCDALRGCLGAAAAAVPSIQGRLQPLCGLYRQSAWGALGELESERLMDWIAAINALAIPEEALMNLGIRPTWCTGVNTPEEFESLVSSEDLDPRF